MPSSFVFTFFVGNSSISAIAVPDTNYEPILYHIKVSDLTFRILPSEAPDGSILWVDEYGDARKKGTEVVTILMGSAFCATTPLTIEPTSVAVTNKCL